MARPEAAVPLKSPVDALLDMAENPDADVAMEHLRQLNWRSAYDVSRAFEPAADRRNWGPGARMDALSRFTQIACEHYWKSRESVALDSCVALYRYIVNSYSELEPDQRKVALVLLADVPSQLISNTPKWRLLLDGVYNKLGDAVFAAFAAFVQAAQSEDPRERLLAAEGLERLAEAINQGVSTIAGDGPVPQIFLLSLEGVELEPAYELVEALATMLRDSSSRAQATKTLERVVPVALRYVTLYMNNTETRDLPPDGKLDPPQRSRMRRGLDAVGDANFATARIYSAAFDAILQIHRAHDVSGNTLANALLVQYGLSATIAMFDALWHVESDTTVAPQVQRQRSRLRTDLVNQLRSVAMTMARMAHDADADKTDASGSREVATKIVEQSALQMAANSDVVVTRDLLGVIEATGDAGLGGYGSLAKALTRFEQRSPMVQQELANGFARLLEPERLRSNERPSIGALKLLSATLEQLRTRDIDGDAKRDIEAASEKLSQVVRRRESVFWQLVQDFEDAEPTIRTLVSSATVGFMILVGAVGWSLGLLLVAPHRIAEIALEDPGRNHPPALKLFAKAMLIRRFLASTDRAIVKWLERHATEFKGLFIHDPTVKMRLENYQPLLTFAAVDAWVAELEALQKAARGPRRSTRPRVPRLAIIGDSGSGKSSLAFDVVWRASGASGESRVMGGTEKSGKRWVLGLVVNNSDFVAKPANESSEAVLRRRFAERMEIDGRRPPEQWIARLGQLGRLVMVVDGVSEIQSGSSSLDHRWIPTIYTSRKSLDFAVEHQVPMGPLSPEQFVDLTDRLVGSMGASAEKSAGAGLGDEDKKNLDGWLNTGGVRLRRAIFAKMVTHEYIRSGRLPTGSSGECNLYRTYVERQISATGGLLGDPSIDLGIIGVVAYSMLYVGDWAPIGAWADVPLLGVGHYLKRLEANGVSVGVKATDVIKRLVDDVDLLMRPTNDQVRFREDPIAECLAAYHIHRSSKAKPASRFAGSFGEQVYEPPKATEVYRYLQLWRSSDGS